MRLMRMLGMTGLGLVSLAQVAAAQDRRVTIINDTNYTIVEFYGSNTGESSWEEDILGQDVLPPGEDVVINFDDGSEYCMFDFRAVFEDGEELVEEGVDVCEISSFRYH
ncbi:MAG: hypothetical protein RIT14_2589 [Pseudomonadota bacterium]